MKAKGFCMLGSVVALGATLVLLRATTEGQQAGGVVDEARRAGLSVEWFRDKVASEDHFREMDGGIALTPGEVQGRNTWIVWTAGNDRFWDHIGAASFGALDFLKTLSSHPSLKFSRDNRWYYLGLVNEPCFQKATGPDPKRYGLWFDTRRPDCPPDPFENEARYPGVRIGARGKDGLPVGPLYGYASGIVGLRIFPNPDFDAEAARKWDPRRYYEDPDYYLSRDLVKPYRVGMSCGFCHVGPNPINPPTDPENPGWANLSANVGAQYFWIDRIFAWDADPSSFVFQLFHTSRPGTLDTSLVSTDNINNPRTMNAVYALWPRLQRSKLVGKETLTGGGLDNKQLNEFTNDPMLTQFFEPPATVWTPRVLKDGADSVGALGALNRVYLNIGLFSEEWLRHFNPLVGGKRTTPIEIKVARENSSYWRATEEQTVNMALFFLKSTAPHRLKDAPGGGAYLTTDAASLRRGKVAFAERCARCHSSKTPEPPPELNLRDCQGANYLDCWKRYWAWTKTTDPLATNAIGGNIWDNFSSQSYKELPSVGKITVHHPITGDEWQYEMPAGGRGYTRPASLISLWSTAPFLLNNSVGRFDPSPSVAARMRSFQDSIEQMLWPERRERDPVLGAKVPGVIDRTTAPSFLRVPAGYLPEHLRPLIPPLHRWFPALFGEDGLEIGPLPTGTPVGLIANLTVALESDNAVERVRHDAKLLKLLLKAKHDLKKLPRHPSDAQARAVFKNLVPDLLELSKCPDFVVNRGHYFGTGAFTEEPGLGDEDKRALIEFLKTL